MRNDAPEKRLKNTWFCERRIRFNNELYRFFNERPATTRLVKRMQSKEYLKDKFVAIARKAGWEWEDTIGACRKSI